jgi:hypothetical protein
MLRSPEGDDKWLLSEISGFNVPVKRRAFPKEASADPRDVLDNILSLAVSLHKNSPLALSAYFLFVLFPRILLRPLPNGCQGRFADAVFRRRCELYKSSEVLRLLSESHEAQTDRATSALNTASSDSVTFSKTAIVAILAGVGEVGRACKVAFTYGIETDPSVAAKFLKKLTLQARHPHITPNSVNSSPRRTSYLRKLSRMLSRGCLINLLHTEMVGLGKS